MKATQGKDYGDIDEMLSVEEVAVPHLDDDFQPVEKLHPLIQSAIRKDRKTHMILKTLAVALPPGDCRVLSGKTRRFQGPPSFPYIPGGDCCGIVVDPGTNGEYFQKGDVVAARFTAAPRDAMAEYSRVSASVCEKVDTTKVTPEAAAVLASASPAVVLSEYICPNERVLILGAGGGIGSHFCQLARLQGASYICGVSRAPERLLKSPLSCDDAVDYTQENIYESQKYQQEPFDTIIDLACGGWPELVQNHRNKLPSIVKPACLGGRYITITGDRPTFAGRSLLSLMGLFLFKPLWRATWSRIFTRRSLPTFTSAMCLPDTRDSMTKTLKLANEGKLQTVMEGPFPMTTKGVREAFGTLKSRHAKGKVVVKVADL